MATQTLKLHSTSKEDMPWCLTQVKELRQGNKIGEQVASFLNRSGIVLDTKQAPNGRPVQAYDIPVFARMAGLLGNSPSPITKTKRKKRTAKSFDPFIAMQDIMSSNIHERTQKVLIALLAKGVAE